MEEQGIETHKASRLSRRESAAWGGSFVLGALWLVAGVLCLGATGVASLAAMFYVGALLAVAGVFGIIWGFRGAGPGALILGVLSVVVGVLLFRHPATGLQSLTLLLIGYFWIVGLYEVITSLTDRYEGWGYDLFYGLCALAVGVIALRAWPVSSFWLLGTLVGAELIVRGASIMAASMAARRVMRGLHQRTAA